MLGERKAHFQHAFLNANFSANTVVQNCRSIHRFSGYQLVLPLGLTLLCIPLVSHHKFVILIKLFQSKASVKQWRFLHSLTISSSKESKQNNKTKIKTLLNLLLFLFSVLMNLKTPNLSSVSVEVFFSSTIKIGK